MSRRKPKELYQEGFLCLFNKQGEMFFRSKTYIHHHANWGVETAHSLHHVAQEQILDIGDEDYEGPMQWHPTWMDAAFLHDGNEEIDEFCFIGHFEIEWENKNKWHYTFGRGYMCDVDGTSVERRAAEDWEYVHNESALFGTISLDKLRVVID